MLIRRSLFVLALLLFAACETETTPADDVVVTEDMPDETMNDDMMDSDTMMDSDVTAEGTLEAIPAEGLTAMDPMAAIGNIDAWIAKLDGADFDNADEIRGGLMQLKDQLQQMPLDGSAIGATLVDLGTWTTEAAPGDGALQQLGSALVASGERLTSM